MQHDIKQRAFERYEIAFNFFMSKPINQLISDRRLPHVIKYIDTQCFIKNDQQFLKRFYQLLQIQPRILRLIQFYQQSLPPPQPTFLTFTQHHIFLKRLRRLNKVKKRRQQQDQSHDIKPSFILQELQHLSIEDIDNQNSIISQLANIKSSIAVEGQQHNIYAQPSDCSSVDEVQYDPKKLMSLQLSSDLILDFGVKKQPKSKKQNMVQHPASFMQYYYSLGEHKPTLIGKIYGDVKFNQRL